MKAKLKTRKEIASKTILVTFEILEGEVDFIPGQFFSVTLLDPPYTEEGRNTKHFSIVNSPNEKGVLTMATRLRDSAFKKSLNEMPLGSEVEISNIMGNFTLPAETKTPLIWIAGGIGITPYISMLRYIKENNLDYSITLIYANRDQGSAAFVDELQALEKELKNFKLILIMTEDEDWTGETRKIDQRFIEEHLPDFKDSKYYVVGAPSIVSSIAQVLDEMGIEQEFIKTENFPGY